MTPLSHQKGPFTSFASTQAFLAQFASRHGLSGQDAEALYSLFPAATDFDQLSLGGVMARVTEHEPAFQPALVDQLWRMAKAVTDPELQPSTYDDGLAFGRFTLGAVLYSRPHVLVIFAAVDRQTSNPVVVKIALEAERTQLLRNEQDLLTGALLGCEGVPQVVQAGTVAVPSSTDFSHVWAIAIEPLGVSLWDVQEQQFPLLSEAERHATLLSWACRLPVILRGIHAHGIVHCDIKPDNIIVTPSGALTIIDFDLALPIAEADSRTENMGTVEFGPMSIWRDSAPSSEETDFISLVYTIQALEEGVLSWLESNRSRPAFERTEPALGSAASVALSLYLQQRAQRNIESPILSIPVSCVTTNIATVSAVRKVLSRTPFPHRRASSSRHPSISFVTDLLRQGRKRVREDPTDILLLDAMDRALEEPREENDLKRRHSPKPEIKHDELAKCDCPMPSELNTLLDNYAQERSYVWAKWHPELASEALPSYEEASITSITNDTGKNDSVSFEQMSIQPKEGKSREVKTNLLSLTSPFLLPVALGVLSLGLLVKWHQSASVKK